MGKTLELKDLDINPQMISESFDYQGFFFQRMTKDGKWYVTFKNRIVNHGQYQEDLKDWVKLQTGKYSKNGWG